MFREDFFSCSSTVYYNSCVYFLFAIYTNKHNKYHVFGHSLCSTNLKKPFF